MPDDASVDVEIQALRLDNEALAERVEALEAELAANSRRDSDSGRLHAMAEILVALKSAYDGGQDEFSDTFDMICVATRRIIAEDVPPPKKSRASAAR